MTGPYRALLWKTDDGSEPGASLTRPAIYALLAIAVLILGLNWPIMVTGLESMTPIWLAAFRTSGAAVVVGLVAAAMGRLVVPPRRDIPMIISVSIFRLAAVMTLVFFALELVPAGRASVLVWTASLWTVPISAIFLGERISSSKWVGVLVGVAGVLVISEVWGNDWRDPDVVIGTALLILAAIVSASTAVHIRRHTWSIEPLQALPWQLIGAAVPLTILGLIVDGMPGVEWTPTVVWVVVYQAIPASGIAFWAQIVVLRNLSAVSTNLTMMGVPVLGVLSSAVFLDETISVSLTFGMVLVFAGVILNLFSDSPGRAAG